MGIKFPVILQLSDKGDSVSTHLVSNIDRSSAIHRTVTNSQRGRFELNPTNAEPACRNLDQGGLMLSPAWPTKKYPLGYCFSTLHPRRLNRFGLLAQGIIGR